MGNPDSQEKKQFKMLVQVLRLPVTQYISTAHVGLSYMEHPVSKLIKNVVDRTPTVNIKQLKIILKKSMEMRLF